MTHVNWSFETKAVHVGSEPCPQTGALVSPIYQTSTYTFKSTEEAGNIFAGEQAGYVYGRVSSPTQHELERKIAALEGGEACSAFASGMAAIASVCTALLESGDHVICDTVVYGGTYGLFEKIFSKYNVEASFIDTSDIEKLTNAIRPTTKFVYLESPANPTLKVVDIAEVSNVCKKHDLQLIVDNTFMTPYFQKPLELGADIVVHSATKFMGGHGDLLAGVVVGSERFIKEELHDPLTKLGGIISPFTCFLVKRGLQTLALRMEKHNANALEIARYLEGHSKIKSLAYPGLESFSQYELVKKQMSGYGGLIAFEVVGGLKNGQVFCDNLKLIQLAVSLGDVGTLIEHPASMTHRSVPIEERRKHGITDGLIRLSVGIENATDIIGDIEQALAKVETKGAE
ncbi:trans-sulfuration enzyme family protein [Sporosarcina sp. G11-34]|uniref:trans-sulfuration enzyme family protein n=1 Tax=Sporosarcina sp. G11-34 TaxID=2849605 RepID=UPI0022A94D74|nr:aminotransferase class I/II-fold pyridoxal phosphate-dependent enzyme [Sporosarcina sp. G11-34]MCZ2258102.1 aminotransferase class I/II-fold pyridoxal phosphate-dependent enzyme [Sporosarcina sp. G11-34]